MKTKTLCFAALISASALARVASADDAKPPAPVHPLSNPVYFDTAQTKRQITAIYAWHTLPGTISTTAGNVPLDGAVHVFALQVEWAFNEQLALVANKDGFVIFDPDNTLNDETGFGDIAAGLKWAFHRGENLTLAARATLELPVGSEDVLQGNGDGNVSPALLATWLGERTQMAGAFGLIVPFDGDEESLMSYLSVGGAYNVLDKLALLLELNWFRVLAEGDGSANFSGQLGSTVPAIVEFEGGDYFNLGAANADRHPDLVTIAFGVSWQALEKMAVAVGYELPLTDQQKSLYEGRLYLKSALRF